jgi:hypothetical protein
MSGSPGDKNVTDAAITQMATPAQARETIEVTLADEAAVTVTKLSESTGISVQGLLEISITILKVVEESRKLGRRVVLTTKFLWPIKEIVFPRS